MFHFYSTRKARHTIQWFLATITILILALGWKYPVLGYLVLAAMTGGMISGPIAGRWFCGNLCPRGGFLERIVGLYSPNKPMPDWAKSTKVRVGVLVFLMLMVGINGSRDPGNWLHWGFVFWLVCFVTTMVGLVLAAFWHPRSWCSICPMGTIQSWLGGQKYRLTLTEAKCKECRACEKVCPMHLPIIRHGAASGKSDILFSPDCIRCGECEMKCPQEILRLTPNVGDSQQASRGK